MNYYSDSEEWKYLFNHAIDWDSIIPLYFPKFPSEDGINNKDEAKKFFEELVSSTGEWTATSVAKRAPLLDKVGAGTIVDFCTVPSIPLQELYKESKDLGVLGLCSSPLYGGLGAPFVIGMFGLTQISRACMSSSTQLSFFTSIADMIERFCSEDDAKRLVPKIVTGEISGSMCLTEPGAGSDLANIKTTAKKISGETYSLNGTKCFITNGGGGIAFVLGKIEGAPEGLNGISLFLVEQFITNNEGKKVRNFSVTKNEHKMGLHGSFTCELVFENSIGKLVGPEHGGLKIMFHLMNEARIAVAGQSLGGIEACLQYVREYAETRKQFGKSLLDLPLYSKNLNEWETERDAFRCLMVDTFSHFDLYSKLDLMKRHQGELTKEQNRTFKNSSKIIRKRTPLVKAYGAELYTHLSIKAIGALGGYGYMEEYPVERYHRDCFGPLLYEGTTQIQSLMALKDLIKDFLQNPSSIITSILNQGPVANLIKLTQKNSSSQSQENDHDYLHPVYLKTNAQFQFKVATLIIKCLHPNQIEKIIKAEEWNNPQKIESLMTQAETIAQGLSYLETLKVLGQHALKNSEREELLMRYHNLILPRLKAIYTAWKIFKPSIDQDAV
jgi:alkylation response protein AidB-like acyl-CoA dehydrogenase